jgi:hypothetical protein
MNKVESNELQEFKEKQELNNCEVNIRLGNLEQGQEKILTNHLPHMQGSMENIEAKVDICNDRVEAVADNLDLRNKTILLFISTIAFLLGIANISLAIYTFITNN